MLSTSSTSRFVPFTALCGLTLLAGCAGGPVQMTPANTAPATTAQAANFAPLFLQPGGPALIKRAESQEINLAASRYQAAVMKTKPIAYFPLNSKTEGSVGGKYTVTLQGGAKIVKGGPIKSERGHFMSLANQAFADTSLSGNVPGTGTLVAWVNLAQLPSVTGATYYVAGESQVGNDFDVQFQNDNNLYFYTASGANTEYITNPSTLMGQWNMIAVTYDAVDATQFQDMYWNGAQVVQTGGLGDGTPKQDELSIGESVVFTGRYFQGGIDAVALWDHALTKAQIRSIFRAAR